MPATEDLLYNGTMFSDARNSIKRKTFLHGLLAFSLLAACGVPEKEENSAMNNSEEVRLMVATDLHHLSKTLYDEESEIFARLMASNDGKLSEESGAIVQALKEKAIEEKPDALLLAGDLTFNGELVSLNELADVFAEIEEAGIPVLVISGNHDINYSGAASYFGSEAQPVSRISPEEFAAVMGPYGFDEALYRDPSSLSYVSEIREDLWLLVLDANVPSEPGSITSRTLAWAEPLLKEAQDRGIHVIVMSHQNVLIQSTMMYNGYVIHNHDPLEHMLRTYGVTLALSGHSHLEHRSQSGGLTDICSESLALYPLQYGMITLAADRKSFAYEKKKLGILEQEAYDHFRETVLRMVRKPIENATDDPSEQACMEEFAVAMNSAYFSGDYEKVRGLADEPGRKLWQEKAGDTFWGYYLENIIGEAG